MAEKHLHIISFNVPFPADYGGVIDVFYRIRALHEAGVKIHLHCFEYGRQRAEELNQYCESVIYYHRSMSFLHQFSLMPFIVKTRAPKALLRDLLKDDYPILFEGLHSCYFLGHPKLRERNKIVRCHNIEHNYYSSLVKGIQSVTLNSYFRLEAYKLRRFEKILHHANHIVAISESDEKYFQKQYGKTFLMQPCHPSTKISIKPRKGHYLLYHGDLSTQENIESAHFIIREIAAHVLFNFILAGKNPSAELIDAANKTGNVKVIANPSDSEMQELIANAQINILPTFQATGFKLKLLNALFNGRYCLVSPAMVEGTGLEGACEIAASSKEFCLKIQRLFIKEFSVEEIEIRTALLQKFTNSAVISKLVELL
jgi:glycosyltransferase involved in cell wall biosynthesis